MRQVYAKEWYIVCEGALLRGRSPLSHLPRKGRKHLGNGTHAATKNTQSKFGLLFNKGMIRYKLLKTNLNSICSPNNAVRY